MKRDKVDDIFSKYIRKRDKWTCQKCGRVYPENSQGLHCSHIFSRRHKTIRWDQRNAKALCFSCHQWYGGNPTESGEWAKEYVEKTHGSGSYQRLLEAKDSGMKVTKADKEEIYQDLKRKLSDLGD